MLETIATILVITFTVVAVLVHLSIALDIRNSLQKLARTYVVNMDKVVVNHSLRNQDPDRVVGAFYDEVERNIHNRKLEK